MRIHTINKKNLSFKQRGALLAEIGMGVALIALLSLLGVMLIPGIVAGMNASKITNEMDSAVPKIQLAYTHRTSFATLTTEEVAKKRWMTDSFLERNGNVPTGRIISKWVRSHLHLLQVITKVWQRLLAFHHASATSSQKVSLVINTLARQLTALPSKQSLPL